MVTKHKRFNVGDAVPDFTVRDSEERDRRLSELTGTGSLVLIFYRGSW